MTLRSGKTALARLLVNEAEVADNLHQPVERIIAANPLARHAVGLEVSGDALARARRNVRL